MLVLFHRGIARLDDFFRRHAFFAVIQLGRPKVKYFNRIVAGNENIVGADISVDNPFAVDFFYCFDDKHDNAHGGFRFQYSHLIQIIFHQPVLVLVCGYVFHNDIRRAVFLKEIKHVDDILCLAELGDALGFHQETLQPFFVLLRFIS